MMGGVSGQERQGQWMLVICAIERLMNRKTDIRTGGEHVLCENKIESKEAIGKFK